MVSTAAVARGEATLNAIVKRPSSFGSDSDVASDSQSESLQREQGLIVSCPCACNHETHEANVVVEVDGGLCVCVCVGGSPTTRRCSKKLGSMATDLDELSFDPFSIRRPLEYISERSSLAIGETVILLTLSLHQY